MFCEVNKLYSNNSNNIIYCGTFLFCIKKNQELSKIIKVRFNGLHGHKEKTDYLHTTDIAESFASLNDTVLIWKF